MSAARDLAVPAGNAPLRIFAQQWFSRVAGAPLTEGNAIELLIDARANFDAWLAAIATAQDSVLFENYIWGDDEVSHAMVAALASRAKDGVRVRVVRDGLGCLGVSRMKLFRPLLAAGGEVRTYNPFNPLSPLGWISRDHRKQLVVDNTVGFVSGVCVSAKWLGRVDKNIPPWRDTGLSIWGPAVQDLAMAFGETWGNLGTPLPADLKALTEPTHAAGGIALRVVATLPHTTGIYRLDQMIAAIAEKRLWLTDAYFVGTAAYVQALSAAAKDGVDVRLLVPGTTDVPALGALSRAGYRSLLETGVRVFEWNGSMLHAKTAVADGRWARVGSTNLNMASWGGNCELDVAIEDEPFARRMEAQYETDLGNATEMILEDRKTRRVRPGPVVRVGLGGRASSGSSRAAAGALRLANTVGAAIANRRVLMSSERNVLLAGATLLAGISVVGALWPRVIAWPFAVFALWLGIGLVGRYVRTVRAARAAKELAPDAQG